MFEYLLVLDIHNIKKKMGLIKKPKISKQRRIHRKRVVTVGRTVQVALFYFYQ